MDIAALPSHVRAADLPLEKLAGSTQVSDADKAAEVSRQFEAVLLRQILAEAQKPVLKSGQGQNSAATSIYQDLITNQLAEAISHSQGLGLGGTLARELSHQLNLKGGTPAAASAHPESVSPKPTAGTTPLPPD